MPAVQFKDYYKTLGLDRAADEKSIRAAYRKLAREHHPDLNPGDKGAEDRFKDLNEAYEVLSDSEKRKLYDRYGEDWQRFRDAGFTGDEPEGRTGSSRGQDVNDFGAWFTGQQGSGGGQTEFIYSSDDGEGFSDFFQTMFGGRSRGSGRTQTARPRPRRGEDLEAPVDVSFDEAFNGGKRQLSIPTAETCPTCGGMGYARGSICPTCDGTGVTARQRNLEVSIPAGVATGSRVRIRGQGSPGVNGGPAGDVYLVVTVRPDSRFEREGDDLRTEVDIPADVAALGGEAVVTTPTGKVALTIPSLTQSGKTFRLRGQGMPKLKAKGQRGDLLAKARIVIPERLSERERELYEELGRIRAGGNA
jgi:molecular chaperone DnaJ